MMLPISSVANSHKVSLTRNYPAFSARTDDEDEYEYKKSNTGKKIMPFVAVAETIIASVALRASMGKEFRAGKAGNWGFATAVAICSVLMAAVGLGVGAIIDACSNNTIQKDAYRFSAKGDVPPDTNKGKITGLIIGSGLGLRHLLGHGSAAAKAFGFGLSAACWTFYCGIYDYAVNKSRDELEARKNPTAAEETQPEVQKNA